MLKIKEDSISLTYYRRNQHIITAMIIVNWYSLGLGTLCNFGAGHMSLLVGPVMFWVQLYEEDSGDKF